PAARAPRPAPGRRSIGIGSLSCFPIRAAPPAATAPRCKRPCPCFSTGAACAFPPPPSPPPSPPPPPAAPPPPPFPARRVPRRPLLVHQQALDQPRPFDPRPPRRQHRPFRPRGLALCLPPVQRGPCPRHEPPARVPRRSARRHHRVKCLRRSHKCGMNSRI